MLLRNQQPRKYGTDDLIYMAEADTIAAIGKRQGIYAADIAQTLGITKSAVSKTIQKLTKKGIITSAASTSDSRKMILNLTPKGEIIYKFHKKIDSDAFTEIMKELSSCSNEELEAYIKIAKIHVNVRYHLMGLNDELKKGTQRKRIRRKKSKS